MADQARRWRGWIPVAAAEDLGERGVVPLRVQGDEMVLWRGESGEPHVLDAFCKHLGAHLAYGGRVSGEDIRCFYHGWTWSPEGKNTDIPYDSRTHRGRRIRHWHAVERGGQVLLWHPGPGGGDEPDRSAPDLPEVPDGADRRLREFQGDLRTVLEMYVDPATAGLLPTGRVASSEVESTAATFRVIHRPADGSGEVRVEILDVASVVVTAPGWSLALGLCPVVDDLVQVRTAVRLTEADAGGRDAPASRLDAAVDRHLFVAARMRPPARPPEAGPLPAFRVWHADLAGAAPAVAGREPLVSTGT